jgi:hypothetical protein
MSHYSHRVNYYQCCVPHVIHPTCSPAQTFCIPLPSHCEAESTTCSAISATGATGVTGAAGVTGATGVKGNTGAQGTMGMKGNTGADGLRGVRGTTGASGNDGITGADGAKGITGADGYNGPEGDTGPEGPIGAVGITGAGGVTGATGATGPDGVTGATGPNGVAIGVEFADFYALMPGDNAAPVAVGADVQFPQNGPTSSTGVTRLTASSFQLANVGVYQVFFQVSINEAAQLVLSLNGSELTYTTVGRATGTSQLVGITLVRTSEPDSILTVRNPSVNATALTITPLAGGAHTVSAHLTITKLA